jgi:hypothetical protein
MTNSEKASRVKEANAVARGATDSAPGAASALAEETFRPRVQPAPHSVGHGRAQ